MPTNRTGPRIFKFGGASLADPAAFRHAVSIVKDSARTRLAVVVSAMGGVTDALLAVASRAGAGDAKAVNRSVELLRNRYLEATAALVPAGRLRRDVAEQINASFDELETLALGLGILREVTARTGDQLVARGERLSARLFAAVLQASGREARYIDALDVIRCDGVFGGAHPDLAATDREARRVLKPLLNRGIVPVVPGFLGRTPDGQLATLGRGGSDLTATLLGRALGASSVSLWKDVPGLLTADPRVVPDARVIPQLNIREAAELAYYGAKVLHPRALIPLSGRNIPLFIRSFANPEAPGTEISARHTLTQYPVKALSAGAGQALITVEGNGMLGVPGIAARTFGALHAEGISVSLISQASSEHSICFSVPDAAAVRAQHRLELAFAEEIRRREIDGIGVRHNVATLAVVGLGMAGTPGVAAKVFSALAAASINVVAIAQGSSELNISVVVDGADAGPALRRIHSAFQLAKIGGGAVSRPERVDIVLLGFGLIGRTLAGLLAKVSRVPLSLNVVAVVDRSGYLFDPAGLGQRRLGMIARGKQQGSSIAGLPGGHSASAEEAIAVIAGHALSHPILVDLTANETTPVLRRGLTAGLDLVLANKRPLSGPRGDADELRRLAEAHGRRIKLETTVGAGLPIIDTYFKLVESGDRVEKIEGCLSGTLGFLLTEIGRGRPFSEALRKAVARGYTEPDPRDDLSGLDVARKALILGRLLGYRGELSSVTIESLVPARARKLSLKEFLSRLEEFDAEWEHRVEAAGRRGAVLRYVAVATRRRITVGLAAVDRGSPFGALTGTDNQVVFTTDRYKTNPLVITGPGAGPAVTAAGVLNDIFALAGE